MVVAHAFDGSDGMIARMRRVVDRYDLPALVFIGSRSAVDLLRKLRRTAPTGGTGESARNFDHRYGTDTFAVVPREALGVPLETTRHGIQYEATSIPGFRAALAAVDDDLSDFTFIDVGSGKGLALLLASAYPFRQIIGVGYSEFLHGIAERNIAVYREASQACRRITSLHCDAVDFDWPDDNLVVFLFNPFGKKIMRRVLANLAASLQARPRKCWLIYLNPVLRRSLDRQPHWVMAAGRLGLRLYSCGQAEYLVYRYVNDRTGSVMPAPGMSR